MTGSATTTAAADEPVHQSGWLAGAARGFLPPRLPPTSRRAFRFHMAYTLLDAVFAGILANAPLMAVKAMNATDVQLEMPLSMAAAGLFASAITGTAMATRRKKPFVLVPGFGGAISALVMACMSSAGWFLAISGIISIFDFGMRPAVPSIVRIIYPLESRSHVSGTLRQYASVLFLCATLGSSSLLAVGGPHVLRVIHLELVFAGLASFASYLCFQQLPDRGDGSEEEAEPSSIVTLHTGWPGLTPFRDRRFRRYQAIFFLFAFSNLFHSGIVPAFLARDMRL